MSARIVSLDEWRALRPAPDDDPPPAAPALRLVGAGERGGDALRLDVFLARARVVMTERPSLHLVERHSA